MNMRAKMTIKMVLFNYMVFITILVSVEIAGQLIHKIRYGKFYFENTRTIFREHPYLSASPKIDAQILEVTQNKSISINNLGYRTTGSKNEIGKKNIVCLGGSTTFGTGVTDTDTWPYILQQKLGNDYNVYNLGVPGYTTLEAIIQLSTIVPELAPDFVILYEGWNDIRNYHVKPRAPDYYWHGMSQKTNLNVSKKEFKDGFFLTRMAVKLRNFLKGTAESSAKPLIENDPYIDSLYARNLKLIQSICNHWKVKVVFVPQVINIKAYAGAVEKSDDWTPLILNTEMPRLINKFNTLMEQSVSSNNTTIVVDSILSKYSWRPEHFIDKAHFSKEGSDYFVSDIVLPSMASFVSTP